MSNMLLRSTTFLSTKTVVPYYVPVAEEDLLSGETDGLAIDFTDTDDYVRSTWAMTSVQERNASVDTLQSPHVFFTQSGTSPKYVKGSSYPLEWSPHNLTLRSQEIDSATWSSFGTPVVTANAETAPDGTLTADTVEDNDAGGYEYRESGSITVVVGAIYTASVYMKAGTSTIGYIQFRDFIGDSGIFVDLTNGNLVDRSGMTAALVKTSEDVGNGWYRITATKQMAGASSTMILAPALSTDLSGTASTAGTGSVHFWGAQTNLGYTPTAYIATTTAAKIGLPISYGEGLLVEPAATNTVLQSQTFSTSWSNVGSSEAQDQVAPDGSTTAWRVIEDSGTSGHFIYNTLGLTLTNAIYTWSIYAKQGDRQWAYIRAVSGAGSANQYSINVDLTNGSVTATDSQGSPTNVTSGTVSVGGGWYRLWISMTATNNSGVSFFAAGGSNSATPTFSSGDVSYTGDGASDTIFWGAQVELGTVATSYVPTVSASATRARDDINVLVSAFGFSATNGTLVMRGTALAASVGSLSLVLDDGTTADQIHPRGSVAASAYRFTVSDNNVSQCQIDTGTLVAGSREYAAAWAANDFRFCLNGTLGTDDTSGTLPTLTTFRIGTDSATSNLGLFQNVIYLPRTPSNAELQVFTT